ncbi:MAG: RNA pyrophosphohydrolase [Rickettsiales bacterium]
MIKNVELYRPGVGLMIVNKEKKVFLGRKYSQAKKYLQMPQGGIELGETPISAAMREMKEEIGTNNCKIILETKKWYFYNIPFKIQNQEHEKKYIGQMQKWFLIEFLGKDEEIDIFNSEVAEFDEWLWLHFDEIIEYTVPFKKKLYISIIKEFRNYFN